MAAQMEQHRAPELADPEPEVSPRIAETVAKSPTRAASAADESKPAVGWADAGMQPLKTKPTTPGGSALKVETTPMGDGLDPDTLKSLMPKPSDGLPVPGLTCDSVSPVSPTVMKELNFDSRFISDAWSYEAPQNMFALLTQPTSQMESLAANGSGIITPYMQLQAQQQQQLQLQQQQQQMDQQVEHGLPLQMSPIHGSGLSSLYVSGTPLTMSPHHIMMQPQSQSSVFPTTPTAVNIGDIMISGESGLFLPNGSPTNVVKQMPSMASGGHSGGAMNVKDLTLNELRPHFNKPMAVVAKELGVCITLMKKICRRNGLVRWPHRRIRSLVNRITSLSVLPGSDQVKPLRPWTPQPSAPARRPSVSACTQPSSLRRTLLVHRTMSSVFGAGPGPPTPPPPAARPPDPSEEDPIAAPPASPRDVSAGTTIGEAVTNLVESPAPPPPPASGWDPAVTEQLRQTMARTWTTQEYGHEMTAANKKLYAVATADYPLHDDSAIRQMSPTEAEALDAYMTGALDLPAPPTFLTCTMTMVKRIALLKFHKEHIEATLIAYVEAKLRLGRNISRHAILRELLTANGGSANGDRMIKLLMSDALRITFDGRNTLSFVFASQRKAKTWMGASLKFRTGVLQLHHVNKLAPGIQSPPQLARQYAVRVLGVAALDPVNLLSIFNRVTSGNVIDIRQRGLDGLNMVDNDYWTVIFRGLECPVVLRGVSCILFDGHELLLHHFQRHAGVPCKRCLHPGHSISRCTVKTPSLSGVRARRLRRFTADLPAPLTIAPADYTGAEFFEDRLETLRAQFDSDEPLDLERSWLAPVHDGRVEESSANSSGAASAAATQANANLTDGDGWQISHGGRLATTTPVLTPIPESRSVSTPHQQSKGKRQHDKSGHSSKQGQKRRGPTTDTANNSTIQTSTKQTKPKATKVFTRFAQQAAAERYQLTRQAFDLLNGDDDEEEDNADDSDDRGSADNELSNMEVDNDLTDADEHDTAHNTVRGNPTQGADGQEPAATGLAVLPPDVRQAYHRFNSRLTAAQGHFITVPANGHSLFSAFHASSINHSHTKMSFTTEVDEEVTTTLKAVIAVLLANLRYDVQLGLVDPFVELGRLYPSSPLPATIQAATAQLYAHYALGLEFSASTKVPNNFYAGSLVLRAFAVHIREPIYVWALDNDGLVHVYQYLYRVYNMPNGDSHDTGVYEALSCEKIEAVINACEQAHVIPTMITCSLSGAQYGGVNWGPVFFEWNQQAGLTMRQRLDQAHTAIQLPPLDATPYNKDSMASSAASEEEAILEEMGADVYASGAHSTDINDPHDISLPKREDAYVHPQVYYRILQTPDYDSLSVADTKTVARLQSSNSSAFEKWIQIHGDSVAFPASLTAFQRAIDWLVERPRSLRHVLAFLPFPEIAVRSFSHEQLLRWGEQEVLHQQLLMFERIANDEEQTEDARAFCSTWYATCQVDTTNAIVLAQDSAKWEQLGRLVDESLLRYRPDTMPLNHWLIMHVVPFVVRDWKKTAMARADSSARALWYFSFPALEKLCASVSVCQDWSAAVFLQLGPAYMALTVPSTNGTTAGSHVAHAQ